MTNCARFAVACVWWFFFSKKPTKINPQPRTDVCTNQFWKFYNSLNWCDFTGALCGITVWWGETEPTKIFLTIVNGNWREFKIQRTHSTFWEEKTAFNRRTRALSTINVKKKHEKRSRNAQLKFCFESGSLYISFRRLVTRKIFHLNFEPKFLCDPLFLNVVHLRSTTRTRANSGRWFRLFSINCYWVQHKKKID